jgi:hypothetical protein
LIFFQHIRLKLEVIFKDGACFIVRSNYFSCFLVLFLQIVGI